MIGSSFLSLKRSSIRKVGEYLPHLLAQAESSQPYKYNANHIFSSHLLHFSLNNEKKKQEQTVPFHTYALSITEVKSISKGRTEKSFKWEYKMETFASFSAASFECCYPVTSLVHDQRK